MNLKKNCTRKSVFLKIMKGNFVKRKRYKGKKYKQALQKQLAE